MLKKKIFTYTQYTDMDDRSDYRLPAATCIDILH